MAQAEPQDPPLFGRSENAVKIQIYAALIAFMLLRILHQTAARAFKASTALLLAQLKSPLFGPLDLRRTRQTAAQTANPATAKPATLLRLPMTPTQSKSRTAVRLRGDDEQGGVPHANFRNEVLVAMPKRI